MYILQEIPERLHGHAENLSWQDCAKLLCLYEEWSQKERGADVRARCGNLAEDVNALPYEWEVPQVEEHGPVTAIAELLRTGVMPSTRIRTRNVLPRPEV